MTLARALPSLLHWHAALLAAALAVAAVETASSSASRAAAAGLARAAAMSAPMKLLAVRRAKRSFPTGDPSFAVMQAFPAGFSAEEASPFLMSDFFGPTASEGVSPVDAYPVSWHPHRGMDLCTYMIDGVGRHADSMGNRETFSSPGMQWVSAGSGIEHAEAGGTPAGENTTGFQIWLNVPSARKMDAPRYGTVPSAALAPVALPGGVVARVLAGPLGAVRGPFQTAQPVEMVHYELPAGASVTHEVGALLDNALVYVFRGGVAVGGAAAADASIPVHGVARFDASDAAARALTLTAGGAGAGLMVFAGKMLKQPIAWHGPVVMTTDAEVRKAFAEMQSGDFPPVRTAWDYKRLDAFPADHPARKST